MDHELLGLFFRGLERLVVVAAALLAIWQGFRLFSTVISDRGSFEGALGQWRIRLQRIAPGIFFAAFGTIIISIAILTPFRYSAIGDTGQPPQAPKMSMLYAAGAAGRPDVVIAQNVIFSITQLANFLSTDKIAKSLSNEDRERLAWPVAQLINHRDSLIDVAYGDGWRNRYFELAEKYPTLEDAKKALPPGDFTTYSAIRSVYVEDAGSTEGGEK